MEFDGSFNVRRYRFDGREVTWLDLAEVNEAETLEEIAAIEIGHVAVLGQCDEIERLPDGLEVPPSEARRDLCAEFGPPTQRCPADTARRCNPFPFGLTYGVVGPSGHALPGPRYTPPERCEIRLEIECADDVCEGAA